MKQLEQQPLRVKLIALVLLLLTFAIVLIGVAGNVAISRYLTDKVDTDLATAAHWQQQHPTRPNDPIQVPVIPSDYVVAWPWERPRWLVLKYQGLSDEQLPQLPSPSSAVPGDYQTVRSIDNASKWRVLVSGYADGSTLIVAKSLADVDGLKDRVFWTTIIIGVAVLILAASLGTEMVRRSMRPLVTIEKTAVAIANGDLTRRVPDPEQGEPEPKTEVGALARSLNTMLTQIENAFTAQAASEIAARAAESAARDAAVAAQASEARARRSEEKMRQFVADASHELRTPLTTIRGFAELYRHGAVGTVEETGSLVKRIEDEARRMGLLVEDLLLLARVDQERPLDLTPVELRVLAVDAVQAARVVAPDREINLVTAPDAGNLVVPGDDARLRQVISNLMGNALAHTPAGTPVELRLSSDNGWAGLEVVDHGQGLDPEQSERVFERFYRADSVRTRRADGHVSTGLGLAIVAALVAAHNGSVEVESRAGVGATFRVRLPLIDVPDGAD